MIISDGKEYESFDALASAWREEEKLWPLYKKMYFAWLRSPYWPSKLWYWFRSHTYMRYHMLDMRNQFYNWGWCDRCDLLLYASFNILCRFIEKEKPPQSIDGEENQHWDNAYREMYALYDWWKHVRKDHSNFETADEDKDQEMLHRLIAIRQYLWT